jgi:hypothetical protein
VDIIANTIYLGMRKAFFLTVLIMFHSQHQAFATEGLDGKLLLDRFKQVNSQLADARIKLGEALIQHIEHQGDYIQTEKMRSIYRLAADYQTFCEGEQRALFLYIFIKDGVRVYISAYSHNLVQKKKKESDASLENLANYSAGIKDESILPIIANLRTRIAEGQELLNQLIEFYSSENTKFKNKRNIAD